MHALGMLKFEHHLLMLVQDQDAERAVFGRTGRYEEPSLHVCVYKLQVQVHLPGADMSCREAMQGLLRKLGAGFDDLMPGMASSSQFKVRLCLSLALLRIMPEHALKETPACSVSLPSYGRKTTRCSTLMPLDSCASCSQSPQRSPSACFQWSLWLLSW